MSYSLGSVSAKWPFIGNIPVQKIYQGSSLVWQNNPPVITAFSSVISSGNVVFTIGVNGTAGTFTRVDRTLGFGRNRLGIYEVLTIIVGSAWIRIYYVWDREGTIGGSVSARRHAWGIEYSGTLTPSALRINGTELNLGARGDVWITAPSSLRPSFSDRWLYNVRFSDGTYFFGTTTGGVTNAKIIREPQGTRVGSVITATGGAAISQTITTPRPTQDTTYRLLAYNTGGYSHRALIVDVP